MAELKISKAKNNMTIVCDCKRKHIISRGESNEPDDLELETIEPKELNNETTQPSVSSEKGTTEVSGKNNTQQSKRSPWDIFD